MNACTLLERQLEEWTRCPDAYLMPEPLRGSNSKWFFVANFIRDIYVHSVIGDPFKFKILVNRNR